MPKKPRKRSAPKQRDLSWKLRHALGHKVEPNPKAYTRKRKHPEEILVDHEKINVGRVAILHRRKIDFLIHLIALGIKKSIHIS